MDAIQAYMDHIKEYIEFQKNQPIEAMDDFFARRVEGYDEHMLKSWREAYRLYGDMVPSGARTAIDLGCGTGLQLEALWERLPDIAVTGIDLTAEMLAELRRKFPDKALTTRRGDYFQLDFGESAFDVALTFESLHHFGPEKKLHLYEKIFRALNPGGVFLYGDRFAVCDEEEALLMAECARKRAAAGIPEGQFVHFDTPLTVVHERKLLERVGFTFAQDVDFADKGDLTTHILVLKKA